jgi:hypothetical protein
MQLIIQIQCQRNNFLLTLVTLHVLTLKGCFQLHIGPLRVETCSVTQINKKIITLTVEFLLLVIRLYCSILLHIIY